MNTCIRMTAIQSSSLALMLTAICTFLASPAQCTAAEAVILAAVTDGRGPDRAFERKFGQEFIDEYYQLYPDRALRQGYFKYAETLLVPDEVSRARELGLLNKWLSQLNRFDPDRLSGDGHSDWALLNNEFQARRWDIGEFREWEWNPALYDIGTPLSAILRTDYADPEKRLRAVLKRLENASAYYAAARTNIQRPTLEHTLLAIDQNGKALELLGTDLEERISSSKLRDNERALFARRLAAARDAVEEYTKWLQGLEPSLKNGGARSPRLGAELFERKFMYTLQSGGSAQALYQRALAEKEFLHDRMDQLAVALWKKYFPNRDQPRTKIDRIDWVLTSLQDRKILSPQTVTDRTHQVTQSVAMNERRMSLVRQFFGNASSAPGWARYSELMALEVGFGGNTPEAWLMHTMSSLRSVCDVLLEYGVQAQNMTEQEAIKLLVEDAFETLDQAQYKWAQAQRADMQLVSDFAVYSEIYDLREQLKKELNAQFDLARFNAQFLNYDRAPVSVIKALMKPALLAQAH